MASHEAPDEATILARLHDAPRRLALRRMLRELAAEPARWDAPSLAEVVVPVCEAAGAHRHGEWARVVELLAPRREQIRLLGGSNAQRDLFMQMLIDAAMKTGRRDIVADMIAHETATRSVPPASRAGYAAAARWLA